MYTAYKETVHFRVIYIREAHPIDGWQVPINVKEKILIADPKTLEERRKVAKEFAAQFKVTLPICVDTLDDQVEKTYAGWPDRFYVIDAEGKIAYKGDPGPAGFRVADVPPELDRLLKP
jgi:Iodothyronine deiodinase